MSKIRKSGKIRHFEFRKTSGINTFDTFQSELIVFSQKKIFYQASINVSSTGNISLEHSSLTFSTPSTKYYPLLLPSSCGEKSNQWLCINNSCKDPLRTLSHIKQSQSLEITYESINLIPLRLPRGYFVTVTTTGALIVCFYAGTELNTFIYLQVFAVNINLHSSKSTEAFMESFVSTA